MNYLSLPAIFLFIFLICACPAPEEDYVIVNQSTDLLNINYKVRNCAENPDWSDWTPMINSYDDYAAASEWKIPFPKENYSLSITSEEIKTSSENDIKATCKIASYAISIPENSALRISYGNFHTPNQIIYLKLEGKRGKVISDESNFILQDLFKPYRPIFFKKTQNTISY